MSGWITGKFGRNRNCLPEIATAPSGPRNDKSGAITILSAACACRRCAAGRGQPGPYNFTALLQNSCGAFLGELAGIEVVVIAALLQQLQVPALLDDAAVAHDEDEVRLADGGQAVSDQERRAVAQQVVDGVLDKLLRLRVDGG